MTEKTEEESYAQFLAEATELALAIRRLCRGTEDHRIRYLAVQLVVLELRQAVILGFCDEKYSNMFFQWCDEKMESGASAMSELLLEHNFGEKN